MKFKVLLLLLVTCFTLNAQRDWRIAQHTSSLDNVELLHLPAQNNERLLAEELERRGPGIAPRFAINLPVQITPETHGTWERTESGKSVWRLRIRSKDAKSLNFGFSKFYMPAGGLLVMYSLDKKTVRGPFSPADNEEHEELWTPIFPADELVLEVQVPHTLKAQLKLELKSINHDFLGFGSVVSGSCNVDVTCGADDGFELIENYRDIIQSVAVIGLNGGTFCTGFLVNNTREDCTPYFMTANHCGISSGNAASLVAYWNYENNDCRMPGSVASGQNGNGQLNDFNSGAIFRSSLSTYDFTLVELDDPVSETANAFFAGWNREAVAPTSAIAVHHPNTEEKRISFEEDPLNLTTYGGDVTTTNYTHVRVPDWDLGTTEGGSSGSPLFDQNKRVVGQLHGGGAACGNNLPDWYGAFSRSWDTGGSPSSRLRDWLDADGTGQLFIDGKYAEGCNFSVDVPQSTIQVCPDEDAVYALIPNENFEGAVQIDVTGIPTGAMFSLSANPVNPGDTTYLTISGINALALDDYLINVNATDSTNSTIEILVLSLIDSPDTPILTMPVNGTTGVSVNPTFRWDPVTNVDDYLIEVATDPGFTNIIRSVTIANTVYSAGGFEISTTYYWRVSVANPCGANDSDVFSFSTPLDLNILTNPSGFNICNTEPADFTIDLGSDFSSSGAMLSAANLPAGASISFSPNPATPGTIVNASIENLETVVAGNYPITISADDGVNMSSRNMNLFLGAAPVPVNMNMPLDNATGIDLQPQFSWVSSAGSEQYTLEVATDSDFNNIVATTTTNITVYSLPMELNENTLYYWRVVAEGDCGETSSSVRRFSTIIINEVAELNNTIIDIRPNPTSGILNISMTGALPDDLIVEVYSINGQRLLQEIKTNVSNFELKIDQHPSGIYLLRLIDDQHVLSRKIVLRK